jgi:formylglycine-generating enzyme required for sulfatase activity
VANNWTNWTAQVALNLGTNTLEAYAVDAAGNHSRTNSVAFNNFLGAVLTVATNGSGAVSPNDNGAFLQVGKAYSLTAAAAAGCVFTNWTSAGITLTNGRTLSFTMASNLVFTANFLDVTPPVVSIASPAPNQQITSNSFLIRGTAGDNVAVASVWCQVTGGRRFNPGGTTNWTAAVWLNPGTNTLTVFAVDTSGNVSRTNAVSFVYFEQAVLSVQTNGSGFVSPDFNGASLQIGKNYSLTATPAAGFAFTNWTRLFPVVSDFSPAPRLALPPLILTNRPTLTFKMADGLVLEANFLDVTPPVVAITAPTAKVPVSNSVYVVTGTAKDNVAVAAVSYQLNGGGWQPASTGNGWTNWFTPSLALVSGTNTVQASAVDTSGNVSVTNWVNFKNLQTNHPPAGMALIPAGAFTMGDTLDGESDALPVSVTVSGFYLDTNLVSFSQWQGVYNWATNHGYDFDNAGSGKAANHPVQTIDWYDCVKWCNARSEMGGLTPAYYTTAAQTVVYRTGELDLTNSCVNWKGGYRLPTEAEWEKAARGGLSGQRFPWGNTISENQANYDGDTSDYSYDSGPNGYNANFDNGAQPYTSPVGYFAPNGYGLYDMAGNVWQWCWDWYGAPYAGGSDPRGSTSGFGRVNRGGSWDNYASMCRTALRNGNDPHLSTSLYLGIRSALPAGQ